MLSVEVIEGASISGLVFSIICESLDSNDARAVSSRHFHPLSSFLLDHFLTSELAALSQCSPPLLALHVVPLDADQN
jgi:hypothetical protein